MRFARMLVLAVVALCGQVLSAQGIQPFSTQVPGPSTTVDMATSNIVLSIPIRAKIGAIPFQYALVANSNPHYGIAQTGLGGTLMGPAALFTAGGALPQTTPFQCAPSYYDAQYTNWTVIDPSGASHPVSLPCFIAGPYTACDTIGSFTGQATDGSGYTLTATVNSNGTFTTQFWDRSGNSGGGDPDGNFLSGSTSWSGNCKTDTYNDTLGQVALKTTFCGQGAYGPDTYVYTDKNGGNQTYTVAYTSMHWKTVTGCELPPSSADGIIRHSTF